MPENRVRIAAVADVHFGSNGKHPLPDFGQLAEGAEVLALCGDLTDRGLPEEAQGLAKELGKVKTPILAVLGNQPGPARSIAVLNAGAAIYVSGVAASLKAGIELASKAIESGAAKRKLDDFAAFTRKAKGA